MTFSAGAVAAGVAFSGGPALAAPHPDAQTIGVTANVMTSTHQKLGLQVSASYTAGVGGPATSLAISLSRSGGSESHTWSFSVPNSAVSITSGGKGTIKVPAAKLAPFGVVKLTVKPSGKPKRQSCNASAHVVTEKVKVAGTLYFDTRSKGPHKWGHFGNRSKATFSATGFEGSAYGQLYTVCISPSNEPCFSSYSWGASNRTGTLTMSGGPAGRGGKGYLDANRSVSLSKPKNATRIDFVGVTASAPKLKTSGTHATMSVTTSGGGASGSAKITNTSPGSSYPQSCGKNKTETTTNWVSALKNGKPALTFSEQIFGPIKLPNGSEGSITRTKK